MNKQEEKQLLKMYELAVDQMCHFYEIRSPAYETIRAEAKVEQLKSVLTVLNIPFKD
jgi:hypothetical protein